MGKTKEAWQKIQEKKDDDVYQSTINDIEDKVDALREFIDPDDIIGNFVLSYTLANVEDMAELLNTSHFKSKIKR
jgi:hypothetical protein